MVPDVLSSTKSGYLTPNIHYDELMKKLDDKSYTYDEFVIVDDEESPTIKGIVSRSAVMQAVNKHRMEKLGESNSAPKKAFNDLRNSVLEIMFVFFPLPFLLSTSC